ncbi:hypothetical protein Nepgr_029675 [Nepenthes gracilis]|uniref:Uncharacterized protein n=1 Tax=Nepenthes gracilis TaxID=150966 RepID=A0AAD3TEG1_NEPGR|nr:hypothetical protein Nepgr_029675 [Nepenthes gracilis]
MLLADGGGLALGAIGSLSLVLLCIAAELLQLNVLWWCSDSLCVSHLLIGLGEPPFLTPPTSPLPPPILPAAPDSVKFSGGSGINLEIVSVSVAGPSLEDSKVASMLCVGADCSTNLDFQNGPAITLAGSPTGRPKLSPDHTIGSGTVSPLLPPSDEDEHCHPEKLMSEHQQLPGQAGASFEGAVSLDARSPEIGLPESVKVSPDLALSGKLPAVPDSGRPPAISWSRVVQEVTVEYHRKLVRCGTCRKVGHSFCHPKKVYKPTGRVLPLPSSFSGPALKNPPSPKEMVKEKHNDIATSNSFEILLEKDDQLNLGNLVSQDELFSEEVVKDSLEYHDACNSCLDLPPPDPYGPITSEVVLVTNEDPIVPKAPLISLAVDVGHSNLEELAFCGNADSCVGIPPKNPICYEELAIISNPLGSLCPNSKLLSNGPDGSPPGRNTRARKAKRSSETGSAAVAFDSTAELRCSGKPPGAIVSLAGGFGSCSVHSCCVHSCDWGEFLCCRWFFAVPAGLGSVTASGVGGSTTCEVAESLASGNFNLTVVVVGVTFSVGCNPCGVPLLVESDAGIWGGYACWQLLCSGDAHDGSVGNPSNVQLLLFSVAGIGVWRVAVGFCFYVKVSFVLLLLCSTAEDGAAGLGAGAFCCRALPCNCVNYLYLEHWMLVSVIASQLVELRGSDWMLALPACQAKSGFFSLFCAIVALQQFAFCRLILKTCLPVVAAFGCCPAAGGVEVWPFAAGYFFVADAICWRALFLLQMA